MTTARDSTMTLDTIRLIIRQAADGEIKVSRAGCREMADALDHLATRAAVVSDEDVESACKAYNSAYTIPAEWKKAMRAALESLASRKVTVPAWNVQENPWYAAVTDACVINSIGWHEYDARKSLHELICWENLVALDPAVSSSARELIEKGRSEVAVPDGWMLVPIEPTEAMKLAGQTAHYEAEEACRIEIAEADIFANKEKPGTMRRRKNRAAFVYKRMLANAPQTMLASQDEVK